MKKILLALITAVFLTGTISINFTNAIGQKLSTISDERLAMSHKLSATNSSPPTTDHGPQTTPLFSDIPPGSHLDPITKILNDKGIIEGYADGTFKPDQTINRAEALKIIFTAIPLNSLKNPNTPNLFSDTPQNAWYYEHILTALNKNIIQGYPDGTFKPVQDVNRAEFIKMAVSALPFLNNVSYSTTSIHKHFQDLEADAWYLPHISIAHTLGFLPDISTIRPSEPMSRGDAAEIIFNMLNFFKKYSSTTDYRLPTTFIPPQSIIKISELQKQQSYFPNNEPDQFSIIPKHLEVSKHITTKQGYRIDYGDPSPIIDATFQHQTLSLELNNGCFVDIREITGYPSPEDYFQAELNKQFDDYPSATSSTLTKIKDDSPAQTQYQVEIIWTDPNTAHSLEHFIWTSDNKAYHIHGHGPQKTEAECDATELNTLNSFTKSIH